MGVTREYDCQLFLVVSPDDPGHDEARAYYNVKDQSRLLQARRGDYDEVWLGRTRPPLPESAAMPGGAGAVAEYLAAIGTADVYRIPRLDRGLVEAVLQRLPAVADGDYPCNDLELVDAFLEQRLGQYLFTREQPAEGSGPLLGDPKPVRD